MKIKLNKLVLLLMTTSMGLAATFLFGEGEVWQLLLIFGYPIILSSSCYMYLSQNSKDKLLIKGFLLIWLASLYMAFLTILKEIKYFLGPSGGVDSVVGNLFQFICLAYFYLSLISLLLFTFIYYFIRFDKKK